MWKQSRPVSFLMANDVALGGSFARFRPFSQFSEISTIKTKEHTLRCALAVEMAGIEPASEKFVL